MLADGFFLLIQLEIYQTFLRASWILRNFGHLVDEILFLERFSKKDRIGFELFGNEIITAVHFKQLPPGPDLTPNMLEFESATRRFKYQVLTAPDFLMKINLQKN